MPIAGENIGTAYVRVIADGKDLDDSLRDMFADADADFNEMGGRGSEAYADGWEKNMRSAPTRNKLRGALKNALASGDFAKEFLESPKWKEFQTGLSTQFGDAGRLAGERLERELFRTGVGGLNLDRLNVEIADAQRDLLAELEKMAEERERYDRDHHRALTENALRAQKEQERIQQLGTMISRAYDEDRARSLAKLREEYALLNREQAQLLSGDYRNAQTKGQLQRYLADIRLKMKDLNYENALWNESLRDTERRLVLLNPNIDRYNRSISKIADTVGVAFGRGSRNNFLNFMGSFARNMALFPRLLSAPINAMIRFGSESRLAFRDTREAGGSMFRSLSAGAFSLLNSVATLPAKIAGGVIGAFGFAGPLLSILSLLAGAVVALSGSIVMGLVGALGALAGAVLPVVAGIGVLIAGLQNIPKEAKKAVKGVKDEFSTLGDIAGESLFSNIGDQASRFSKILVSLRPIVRGVGNAISNVGDRWLDMMEGQGFNEFRAVMETFIPDAVESLGISLGQALGGFGGILRGLEPITRDFLGWLEDITGEFSEWANSAVGQRSIVTFMNDAADSARELGDFIGSVSDLFWTLINTGNEAGDSLFASMTDAVDRWTEALQADNGTALREWFGDAVEFGEAIGDMITQVGSLFDTLDTEASRMLVTSVFETLATSIELLVSLLSPVTRLLDGANQATDGFVVKMAALALIGPKVVGMLGGFVTSLGGVNRLAATGATNVAALGTASGEAVGRMSRLQMAARNAGGIAGLGLMAAGATTSNSAMGTLLSTLGGAATGFAIGGPIGALVGGGLGGLLGIATAAGRADDQMRAAAEAAEALRVSFKDAGGTLDATTGKITENTRQFIIDQLNASEGLVAALEAEGLSRREMVNGLLGESGARKQVGDAIRNMAVDLDGERSTLERLEAEYEELSRSRGAGGRMTDATRDRIAALEDEIAATKESIAGREQQINSLYEERNAIRAAIREKRADIAAMRDYSGLLKGLPQRIKTKVEADGIIPTVAAVARLAGRYKDLDKKDIKTLIEASGVDTTVDQVRKVMRELGLLDRQQTEPEIGADDRKLKGKIKEGVTALANLGRIFTSPTITADNSPARAKISETEAWLNRIQDEIVYINVERRGGGVQEFTARGGIFYGQQSRIIAESGAEAVVPLNRDLSQVDPAVRWLSAIAQGIMPTGGTGGKTIDASGWTIVTPTEDPYAVAKETVNQLVASAYGG